MSCDMTGGVIARIKLEDGDVVPVQGGSLTLTGIAKLVDGLRGVELPESVEAALEYDPNHLRDVLVIRQGLTESDRNAKLGAAYTAAVEASHSGTAATLEVGQDVWDYLMSIREVDTSKAEAPGVFKGMEWLTGIRIACQPQWPNDFRIDVVTRKEIA